MPKKRGTAPPAEEDPLPPIQPQELSSDEEPAHDNDSDVSDGDEEDIRAAIADYLAAAQQQPPEPAEAEDDGVAGNG
jgi:hypothetical protein